MPQKSNIDDNIELYILKALLSMPDYTAKYIEKLDRVYFSEYVGMILRCVQVYHIKYKKTPSIEILCDKLIPRICKNDDDIIEQCEDIVISVKTLSFDTSDFFDWISDETKDFIRRKRIEIALINAVEMVEHGKLDQATQTIIEASNIVFDDTLGHDYLDDIDERVEYMKSPKKIIPSGLKTIDKNIGGGWRPKSLVVFGAATNVGKTLVLGDISFKLINQGLNGLYITLEISENVLANRIDANLTNIKLADLDINADLLLKRVKKLKKQRKDDGNPLGRLIIKEYPPTTLSSNGIMTLIRELELKRNFRPDFIVVDYLGLMAPNGKSFSENSYGKLKSVSEEIRAVSSFLELPIFTAVQVNRNGFNSSIVGLENTADSMAIAHTADLMIMMSRTEETDSNDTMCWHVAKSRFCKNNLNFFVKVDYDHMRLLDDEYEERSMRKEEEAASKIKNMTKGVLNDI